MPPRGLSEEEAHAWARLASTVTPFAGKHAPVVAERPAPTIVPTPPKAVRPARGKDVPSAPPAAPKAPANTLDSQWDRKLKSGQLQPDFTLDLHGHTLDTAYHRLLDGMRQALAMDARTILLIAGKERPVDPADRGQRRGAIRAKILDWLAASEFSSDIAAVRRAHIRHGGEGALYLVLKRRR